MGTLVKTKRFLAASAIGIIAVTALCSPAVASPETLVPTLKNEDLLQPLLQVKGGKVEISGATAVGEILTASIVKPFTANPTPSKFTYVYRWYRTGQDTPIKKTVTKSGSAVYVLSSNDLGKTITVQVVAYAEGNGKSYAESPTRQAKIAVDKPGQAQLTICQDSIPSGKIIAWAPGTVDSFRQFGYGGPIRTQPLKDAYPGLDGNTLGAWCFVKAAGAGRNGWWVAVPGQSPRQALKMVDPYHLGRPGQPARDSVTAQL